MEKPRGICIGVGGGEDKLGRKFMLERVLDETRRRDPIVEIITAVPLQPGEEENAYTLAFEDLGVEARVINLTDQSSAKERDFIRRISICDLVFFSGGNHARLASAIKGSEFIQTIKQRYIHEKKFVIAGAGQGASALCSSLVSGMITQDNLIKGELQISEGYGFLDSFFLDTHFIQRGRFCRVVQNVIYNPSLPGVALAEEAGVVIYNGTEIETMGDGFVSIIDGSSLKYSNLHEIRDGDAITVQGLQMHVLAPYSRFDLGSRSVQKEK